MTEKMTKKDRLMNKNYADNVSIENETDWLQMANFHADWTKKFYDVIVPYIKVV